jgi:hypothetical protein
MVVFYFRKVMDGLWPGGGPLTYKPARKPDEKLHTKEDANRKLSTWLPGKEIPTPPKKRDVRLDRCFCVCVCV